MICLKFDYELFQISIIWKYFESMIMNYELFELWIKNLNEYKVWIWIIMNYLKIELFESIFESTLKVRTLKVFIYY